MYEQADFSDSLATVCQDALSRLDSYRNDSERIAEDDFAVEHILGTVATSFSTETQTQAEYFAATFSDIHPNIIEQDDIADYFCDVITEMVRAYTVEREQWSKNEDITLLMPDSEALKMYVQNRWLAHEVERKIHTPFSVYNFLLRGDSGQILFTYDELLNTWQLGYRVIRSKLILRAGDEW
jgi:hypothetical protein